MSSTDDDRLGRFFDRRLEPAARKLRERGFEFFPMGPDATDGSYYVSRIPGPDFSTLDDDEWVSRLRELWSGQGIDELVELVDEMATLAAELEVAEEQTADISPFVYVMY